MPGFIEADLFTTTFFRSLLLGFTLKESHRQNTGLNCSKMVSQIVAWDRLVRYIASDGASKYGVPIASADDNIAELSRKGELKVKVCTGSTALSAKPTDQTETVKTLLGPLTPQEVPYIRCVGLNYKTHSMLLDISQKRNTDFLT